MNKLNNKGMTLTELLVSITMLSVAMVLMYGLMSNLQKKKNEVDLRTDDLVKISDIEEKLQDYIMGPSDYGRNSVSSVNVYILDNKAIIKIDSTTHTIEVNNNVITYYQDTNINKTKWTLKNKTCDRPVKTNTSSKDRYIVITCTANTNNNIKDYIRIPMFFSKLSGDIT